MTLTKVVKAAIFLFVFIFSCWVLYVGDNVSLLEYQEYSETMTTLCHKKIREKKEEEKSDFKSKYERHRFGHIYLVFFTHFVINRPGVAGAVLQKPS